MSTGRRLMLRRLLTGLVVVAAVGFLVYTAASHWSDLRAFDWQADPLLLSASIVAHLCVLVFGVWIWARVLGMFGREVGSFTDLLRIWAFSNATRYIPGGIWQFLAAAQMARGVGVSGTVALTSMVVHVLFSLTAALCVAALTLPLSALGAGPALVWLVRIGVPLSALAAVHPRVIDTGLGLVPRLLRREVLHWKGRWRDGVFLLALSVASWLVYGLAYTLFVASLAELPAGAWIGLTAVHALSFTAGYLVVLAPGGIGVRESAMTILLAPLLSPGVAAVVSIAARLWSVVTEILLALLALALRRRPLPPATSTAARR